MLGKENSITCVAKEPYTASYGFRLSLVYIRVIKNSILIIQEQTFDTSVLRQLVRTGKAGELVAKGVPGGFVLAMRDGLDEQLLRAQRGGPRRFKRLEALANYLHNLGARRFEVELGQWSHSSLGI